MNVAYCLCDRGCRVWWPSGKVKVAGGVHDIATGSVSMV